MYVGRTGHLNSPTADKVSPSMVSPRPAVLPTPWGCRTAKHETAQAKELGPDSLGEFWVRGA